MREVSDLATSMKGAISALRKIHADARAEFEKEVTRANLNAGKVKALTSGLKEANSQVESFLGEAGTNFPPETEVSEKPHTDLNGVTLHKGTG